MSVALLSHQHSHGESAVHRLSAPVKLAAGLVIIIGTVLAPLPWMAWFLVVGGVLVAAALASRLPLGFLAKRLFTLLPFVLGVAVVNAWRTTGSTVWLGVAVKSVLCLTTVILISNTTPLGKILRVLESVRVPRLLITTIALMHRYLYVLGEEAGRMRRARESRTFVTGRRAQWRSLAAVVGQLFVRASERAERIYDAMCARGWK